MTPMPDPEPSYSSDDVFVSVDDLGRNEYHHRPCGKVWYEKADDHSPNWCPGCGEELFTDELRVP